MFSASSPHHDVSSLCLQSMASSSSGGDQNGGPLAPPTVSNTTARAAAAAGRNNHPPPTDTGQSPLRAGLAGIARVGRQLVAGISPQNPRNNTVVIAGTPANAVDTTNANGTPQASNRSNRSRGPQGRTNESAASAAAPSNDLTAQLTTASTLTPAGGGARQAEAPVIDISEQEMWNCPKNCGKGPWPATKK